MDPIRMIWLALQSVIIHEVVVYQYCKNLASVQQSSNSYKLKALDNFILFKLLYLY